jgi:hypothetical protein
MIINFLAIDMIQLFIIESMLESKKRKNFFFVIFITSILHEKHGPSPHPFTVCYDLILPVE